MYSYNRQEIHAKIYFGGIILLAMSIPLSEFMMSIAQFILAGNWLIEGGFKNKFNILKTRKSILIFLTIFIIHILGLIVTDDFKYGFNDIRIKIPLFILPLIIGTTESLNEKQIKTVLTSLSIALFAGSVSSMLVVFGYIHKVVESERDISLFISHIRFALLLNVAIFSMFYFIISKKIILSKIEKIGFVALLAWFIVFLFILKSVTGIIIFLVLAFALTIYVFFRRKNPWYKASIIGLTALGIGLIFYIVYGVYSDFYNIEKIDFKKLEEQTASGNAYHHDTLNRQIENGHYTYIYVCEKELEKEWNKKSSFAYKGKDKKNHDLKYTLIRYLTSLGLRKDAEGVLQLKSEDIKVIENGYANQIYKSNNGMYNRIYEIIWEFDVYKKGANPSGHSITQRIEFLKAAKNIVLANFWFGVGTGDVKQEFLSNYENTNSILTEKARLRAHNQLVTFFITFGLIGFLWILFALFYPIYLEKGFRNILFTVFLVIAMLSMLNEDTLETQAGVTFFAFLYSLLLFGASKK
ncbi:MAG: hypothetical protein A2W98_01015 [Bacteroidetes bacterium GWF2_33_38]|nr:MAG: hypothetical protein A2W98_01015 [Bacteroidetes bacterium GWF2_33_38]OFY74210.1 MAG: hypothetical protein A2265_04785 [Bacteroidetes bacterium RIFOXYA12_FULL_33_9]OFY89862.1 MAG: hypothetical protein A2236_04135 [Bacteroidetes bacterium RIFOXYA2_FULL_33_7]HBX50625.1 hypothetical protein [Bacteroidales bacterium]